VWCWEDASVGGDIVHVDIGYYLGYHTLYSFIQANSFVTEHSSDLGFCSQQALGRRTPSLAHLQSAAGVFGLRGWVGLLDSRLQWERQYRQNEGLGRCLGLLEVQQGKSVV
jgi:hypothetical protein